MLFRSLLERAVEGSTSMSEVLRKLGVLNYSGSLHNHLREKIQNLGIPHSFECGRGWAKGKTSNKKKPPETILRCRTSGKRAYANQLRRALIEVGVSYTCALCGQGPLWRGNKLVLQVDHLDGNWLNDSKENLRFLCPNCHTQTPSYGRKSQV